MANLEQSITIKLKDDVSKKMKFIASRVDKLKRGTKRLSGSFSKLKSSTGALAKRLAIFGGIIGGATFGIFKLFKGTVDFGDEIAKTSKRIGLSTDSLQAWNLAAGLGGANAQDVATGFRTFSKAVEEAREGVKTYSDNFEKLGIKSKDANGNLKDTETLVLEAADALSKLENKTQQVAIAQELFGRAGVKLLPVFEKGAAGIESAKKEMADLGLIIQGETLGQLEEFNDQVLRTTTILKGLKDKVLIKLLPILRPIIDRMVEQATAFAKNEDAIREVAQQLKIFVTLLVDTAKAFVRIARDIAPFIEKIGGVKTVLTALAVAIGATIIAPIVILIKSLVAVGAAIGAIPIAIGLLVAAAVRGVIVIIKNWDKLKDFFIALWSIIESSALISWLKIKDTVLDVGVLITSSFIIVRETLKSVWEAIKDGFGAAFEFVLGIVDVVMAKVETLKNNLLSSVEKIKDIARTAGQAFDRVGGFFGFGSDDSGAEENTSTNNFKTEFIKSPKDPFGIAPAPQNNVFVNLKVDENGKPVVESVKSSNGKNKVKINTGNMLPAL